MEEAMSSGLNREICHCKKVTYNDIEKALHDSKNFGQVEKAFEDVQMVTHCSTGCGFFFRMDMSVYCIKGLTEGFYIPACS